MVLTKSARTTSLVAALFVLTLAISACSEFEEDDPADPTDAGITDVIDSSAPDAIDPSIPDLIVSSQALRITTAVPIDTAVLTSPGSIRIYQDDCDEPDSLLGQLELDEGVHTDLLVELSSPLPPGDTTICAALVDDSDESQPSDPISQSTFTAEVLPETPEILIRLASQGSLSYTLLEVIPSYHSDLVDIDPESNSDDLRFTFIEGLRYEIDNTLTNAHPFQFRAADSTPQLAQNEAAPLEDDPTIDWDHQGSIMRFTVSQTFRDTITNYQCAPHVAMAGAVQYSTEDDL